MTPMISKIVGVGVDIEEVSRFYNLPFKDNQNFYKKIFTEKEIKYCLAKGSPPACFAVRFSAKEAVVKALPEDINDLLKIEIVKVGKIPQVKVANCLHKIHLSLSHSKTSAIAFVVVQKSVEI